MASIFTRIIAGEIPGRFVWKDDRAVAFLSVNPLRPGHTLVVPREEVDHWIDLPPDLHAHLGRVSRSIGKALMAAFKPVKIGFLAVGLEVPHVHFHLVPIERMEDLDFRRAEKDPDAKALDEAAERIRAALRDLGFAESAA